MNKIAFNVIWILCVAFVHTQRLDSYGSGSYTNNRRNQQTFPAETGNSRTNTDLGKLEEQLEEVTNKNKNLEKRLSKVERFLDEFKNKNVVETNNRLTALETGRAVNNKKIQVLEGQWRTALSEIGNLKRLSVNPPPPGGGGNCCAENSLEISTINQNILHANSKIDINLRKINDQERKVLENRNDIHRLRTADATRWQTIETQVHEITENVRENSRNIFGNASKVMDNSAKIHQQNLKFSSIFATLKTIDTNNVKYSTAIDENSERIDSVAADVGENAEQIRDILKKFDQPSVGTAKLLEINKKLQVLDNAVLDNSKLIKINVDHIVENGLKIGETAKKVDSCCSKANLGISALVEQNSKKIEGLLKSVQQNSGKIEKNSNEVKENSQKISGVFDKVQQNAEKVGDLSAKFLVSVDAIEDIEKKCQKFKDLSLLVEENSRIIQENSGKIGENSKNIQNTVAKTLENLNKIEQNLGKIDSNSKFVYKNSVEMKTVLEKQAINSDKLMENTRKLDQNSKQIEDNSRINQEHLKKIDENGKKLKQNAENILNSNQEIQNNLRKIGENSAEIKTNSQLIHKLSKNIEGISNNVKENSAKIDQNSRKITSNEQKIAENDVEIDQNAQKINSNQLKIKETENKVEENAQKIKSNQQQIAENEIKIDKNSKNGNENFKKLIEIEKKANKSRIINDDVDKRKETYQNAIEKFKNDINKAKVTPSATTPTNLGSSTLWDPEVYKDSRPLTFTWTIDNIAAKLGQNLPALESGWFKFPHGYPFEAKAKLFLKDSTDITVALVFKEPGSPFSNYFPFPQITYVLKDRSGQGKDRVTSASLAFNSQALRANEIVLEESLLYKLRLRNSHFVKDDAIVIEVHVESPSMARQNQSENGELFNRVEHFKERKQLAHDYLVWYTSSPYFYTHPGGYRVQLQMYLNVEKEISPHLLFLTTDHDRALPASFPHRTTLTIFNPKNDFKNNLVIEKEADIGDYGLPQITYDQVKDLVVHNTLYYHVKIVPVDYVMKK